MLAPSLRVVVHFRCGPEGGTMVAQSKTQMIINDLSAKISSGDLKPGDRLPSTAELCDQYGVSLTTVRAAINWLKALGMVEGLSGVGVFVAGRSG